MSWFDRAIAAISPEVALRRQHARARLDLIQASGYSEHGASRSKKSLAGWLTSSGAPADDIDRNVPLLRERSRDLFMGGSPMATGAVKTIRTNVVGSGLRLNAQIDWKYLGITEDAADELEEHIEREFSLWADSQDCDAARMCTFGQLQSLAMVSALVNGDVFCTLPVVPRVGRTYDLRVALIEGDRVTNPTDSYYESKIIEGVDVDSLGAPKGYYIADRHPSDFTSGEAPVFHYVPAFGATTGRRNVLHIIQEMERVGQRRGVPLLAPVMEAIKQLGRYTHAELMAALVSGMFSVFLKTPTPEVGLGDQIPFNEQVDQGDPTSYELGNGAIVALGEGEDISVANPGRPNTAFDGFVIAVSRQIGAALELPYELLMKQFTASYSASRAALLEAWKMFRMRRQWLVQNFCQPIYEEWFAEAVAKGRIAAPGFFEDEAVRKAWTGAEWYGPAQGQLDPLKEANAAKVRVEEEFSTREREAAELSGQSFERIHSVRVREEKHRRDGGLGAQPQQSQQAPAGRTGGDREDPEEEEEDADDE